MLLKNVSKTISRFSVIPFFGFWVIIFCKGPVGIWIFLEEILTLKINRCFYYLYKIFEQLDFLSFFPFVSHPRKILIVTYDFLRRNKIWQCFKQIWKFQPSEFISVLVNALTKLKLLPTRLKRSIFASL